jgi:hypothetical protein
VHKQYTAIFAIGGKLLGSFRGAMAAAGARLRALGRTARSALSGLGSILSKLSIAFSAFAGYAAGKVIGSVFQGAVQQAVEMEERVRSMNYTLLQNNAVRKMGLAYSKEQTRLIIENNENLAKTGVLNDDIYNEMAKGLALYAIPPKAIREAVGPMADMLVATKGVMATEEDAAGLATSLGKAIVGGPTRGLQKYGIVLDKNWKKEFPTQRARMENLKKLISAYRGANVAAEGTPLGKIRQFQNTIQKTREEIGMRMLPAVAALADAWREFLTDPQIKGMLIKSVDALATGITNVADIVRNDLIPMLSAVGQSDAFKKLSSTVTAAASTLKKFLDIGGAVAKVGAAWDETFEQRRRAFAGLPGPYLPDVTPMEKALVPMQKLTGVELFKPMVEPAKQFNVAMDQLPSSLAPSAAAMNDLKAASRDVLDLSIKLPPEAIQVAETMTRQADAVAAAATQAQNAVSWFQVLRTLFIDIARIGPMGPIQMAAQQSPVGVAAPPAAPAPTPGGMQLGGIVRSPIFSALGERGPEAVIPLSGGRRAAGLLNYANRMLGMNAGATAVSFAPVVTINGNATESEQRAMDTRLRDLCRDFISQFKAAQYQERRLSYQGGYG